MSYFEPLLFLGLPITQELERDLALINQHLYALLTSGGLYLSKVSLEEQRYLGKYASALPSLPELILLEANILSLLKKMLPNSFSPLYLYGLASN